MLMIYMLLNLTKAYILVSLFDKGLESHRNIREMLPKLAWVGEMF